MQEVQGGGGGGMRRGDAGWEWGPGGVAHGLARGPPKAGLSVIHTHIYIYNLRLAYLFFVMFQKISD